MRGLVLHPGAVHRARLLRQPARHRHRQDPCDAVGDRRRLRRQDRGLSGADRAQAVADCRPAGQDGDVPRGSLPCQRPDLGRRHDDQDGRHQGWQAHCGQGMARLSGRRLPRLADPARLHVRLRPLRHRARRGRGLRRGGEPAQGGCLPRAGRADLRVRLRGGGRRDREEARHRPRPSSASGTRRRRAPAPSTAPSSGPSAASKRWRPHATASTTTRRSAPTRGGASPPASGSTSAASPAPPSTSTRTARRP